MFEPDLADRVDDLICIFEGGNPDREMDTISMLLTGWIIFLFSSIALVKFLYIKYVRKEKKKEQTEQQSLQADDKKSTTNATNGHVNSSSSNERRTDTANRNSNSVILTAQPPGSRVLQNNNVISDSKQRLLSQSSSSSFDAPASGSCTGPDPVVVDYINKCYSWLYSTESLIDNSQTWENIKDSLIDTLGKILREQGKKELPIFVSIVDINLTSAVQISNLYAECEHTNNIKLTCDCEVTKLQGVLSLYSTETGSSSCEFYIDRICGRLNVLLDCEEQGAIVKFDGWPEICVGIKTSSLDSKLDSKTSEYLAENLASAIRSAVLEIEFKRFLTFPAPAIQFSPKPVARTARKKFLVAKVIRGVDLGKTKGCEEPYCAIELDDPPQKFQTEHLKASANPQWNESFVFNVSSNGGEILLEVFDYVGTRFLGCNIVSVDEIRSDAVGQNRVHTLPLKSRRMEMTDQVTGTIDVHFTLVTESELVQKAKVEDLKGENLVWNGNLKGLENSTDKSVFVVKSKESPNFQITRPIVKIVRTADGFIKEVNEDDVETEQKASLPQNNEQAVLDSTYGEERGRRKTRKGDIFTSIRRRFSKGRSISMLPPSSGPAAANDTNNSDPYGRSVSADRQSLGSTANNTLGVNSTRSSASELSGLSGQSTTTFIHENSTLVVECNENRVKKYYLVPPHLAETGKWKKRGKKLHIYNDHTFVAKRMSSGTPCSVCFGRFQFSLGKQGYQCRDCKLICHKQCHIRAPTFCGKTTVYDIELAAVKPLQPAPLSKPKTKSSSSPFHSIAEYFMGKKNVDDVDKKTELPLKNSTTAKPAAAVEDDQKNTTKKVKPNITPTYGAPAKLKPTRKMNIFKRANKLGKISEEVPTPTTINNSTTPSPNLPASNCGQGNNNYLQESTVTILIQNEEEDLQEQETTALIQTKCNTIISTQNIKGYSIE